MRGYIPPQNNEEVVFAKKIHHTLDLAETLGCIQYTLFMDLRQQELFIAQANKFTGLNYKFFSGYIGDDERKLAAIYPNYMELYSDDLPIVVIKSKLLDKNLSHKDFLGTAMSLKIKREYMGDIVIYNDNIYIMCHKNISNILIDELVMVKKTPVSFEICDEELHFQKEYSLIKTSTVASMRVDSVVSAMLNCSRSEAVKLIKQGNIRVNQLEISHSDFEMFDNDIISIKYNGKYKLFCDGGKSRKDRIFIKTAKY